MNNNKTSFFYNPLIILFLLFSFLFLEFSLERIINLGVLAWPYSKCWCNILFIVLFSFTIGVIITGRLKNNYKLSSLTLKQLISNALGYKSLTLIILFFFITHLTWAIDSSYKIIIDTEVHKQNWILFLNPIIPIFGMFVSAILIPPIRQENKKSLNEADIFISSISCSNININDNNIPILKPHNLDLFFKPFYNTGIYYQPTKNIEILSKIDKFIIVPSTSFLECTIDTNADWSEFIAKLNKVSIAKKIDTNQFDEAIKTYNSSLKKQNKSIDHLKNFLEKLINVNLIFSEVVDYNEFEDVFNVASKLLKKHEKETSRTLIHISPGTAIPAGALTTLGIKKNRTIIYTLQNPKDNDKIVSSIDITVDSLGGLIRELNADSENK